MRYLASQLDFGKLADAAEGQRALERLQERVEDVLAHRTVYAPDYPWAA